VEKEEAERANDEKVLDVLAVLRSALIQEKLGTLEGLQQVRTPIVWK
jgi:hypothetical protein